MLRKRQPLAGWARKEESTLVNSTGLQINLERTLVRCRNVPASCTDETIHLVDEAVKIATRPSSPPASRSQLMAIVRPRSYLEAFPQEARGALLTEPLTEDLVVIYMVDLGGSARGAREIDLTAAGVRRDELATVARKNLEASLPRPPQKECSARNITMFATGNFYETSRLLLTDFWRDFAGKHQLVVSAPSADALVVACDLNQRGLHDLATMTGDLFEKADRGVSKALLGWTGSGWKPQTP